MPELPEVEVVCRGLAPLLRGRKISSVTHNSLQLRHPFPDEAEVATILNSTIVKIYRRAKYIIIGFGNRTCLVIHLGMTGRLGVFQAAEPRLKHDHIRFRLDGGRVLRLNDSRRFGSVRILDSEDDLEKLLNYPGPDPFSDSFNTKYLLEKSTGKRRPVKNFLMDARVVAGIGNIYASELLHRAAINPHSEIRLLKKEQWGKIIAATREILHAAIDSGGTTISDYADSEGRSGYFQIHLRVYGKETDLCPACNSKIVKTVLAGRATFHCPKCQK